MTTPLLEMKVLGQSVWFDDSIAENLSQAQEYP